MVGELLKQADRYIAEGLHPRVITDGYEIAKDEALKVINVHSQRHVLIADHLHCSFSTNSNFRKKSTANFSSPLHEPPSPQSSTLPSPNN
jgi:hypothetical protein